MVAHSEKNTLKYTTIKMSAVLGSMHNFFFFIHFHFLVLVGRCRCSYDCETFKSRFMLMPMIKGSNEKIVVANQNHATIYESVRVYECKSTRIHQNTKIIITTTTTSFDNITR